MNAIMVFRPGIWGISAAVYRNRFVIPLLKAGIASDRISDYGPCRQIRTPHVFLLIDVYASDFCVVCHADPEDGK
jgi:hypothetical protein